MKQTLIIAEAGVNHNGNIEIAKQLIDVAAIAGADYVKFQTFKAEKIVSPSALKAAYQIENTERAEENQLTMIKKLEIDRSAHEILIEYCSKKGIQFLSTAFDPESIDLLNELGLNLYKIPSGEITNLPYLRQISQIGKPIILSTGMSTLGEIETALKVLINGNLSLKDITVLHCNTEYPTPFKDVNLKAMLTIHQAFGVKVGYSDHTLGIEIPIAAVAMGASVIEKHFTLDRNMEGPDHRASLEPNELLSMVSAIRNVERGLSGSGLKVPSASEIKNIPIVRKSIHLANPISKGEVFEDQHLLSLRPGDGLSPMFWDKCIGRIAKRNLPAGHKLSWNDLQ